MRTGRGRFGAQAQGPVNRKRRRRPGAAETKGRRGVGSGGSARRAGVLAAGGRMVQKEGQAALEEPQGSPNPAGASGAPLEPPGAAAGAVPGGEETDTETETALGSRRFLCGVVEGESWRGGEAEIPAPCAGGGSRGSGGAGWGRGSRGCRAGRLVPGAAGWRALANAAGRGFLWEAGRLECCTCGKGEEGGERSAAISPAVRAARVGFLG